MERWEDLVEAIDLFTCNTISVRAGPWNAYCFYEAEYDNESEEHISENLSSHWFSLEWPDSYVLLVGVTYIR